MRIQTLALLLVACVLPGCSAPTDPASSDTAPSAQTAPTTHTPGLLRAPALATCDDGQTIEITWDVTGSRPDLTRVQVLVGDDVESQVFAEGGASGAETTGPWAAPGKVFRLIDPATGETLERVALAGPGCRVPAGP
ncbi:hypothetical protein AO715_06165 [Xanthomonas sp. Mitacek01]|nr:hypothetical protein AO715_06165 [Xanthomonas sp. Mitacek01]